jgi:hypothetical protein
MKSRNALIVVFALAATNVAAETVYKSIMPDGSIVYGSSPAKGAVKIEPISVEPPLVTDSPAATSPETAAEASRLRDDRRNDEAAWAKATEEIRSAEDALDAAKVAQQSGIEPLPGEMMGIAGGGARPSEAYFARQRALADKVKEAQARVDAAVSARNALRR